MDRYRIAILSSSFILVLVLFGLVLVTAIQRMSDIQSHYSAETTLHTKKIAYISTIREGIYNRILLFRNILHSEDLFEITETADAFHAARLPIEQSIQALKQLPLTETEKTNLEIFVEAGRTGTPLHRQIIDLIISGKKEHELTKLIQKATRAQEDGLQRLRLLNISLEEAVLNDIRNVSGQYQSTRNLLLVAGIFAVLTAILIAFFVTRYIYQQSLAVENERQKFKNLFKTSLDAVAISNEHSIIECNRRFLKLFGLNSQDEAINTNMSGLSAAMQPDDMSSATSWEEKVSSSIRKGGDNFEWLFKSADGNTFHGEVSISPLDARSGQFQLLVRDITENKKEFKELSFHARHDPLTGLINRREFTNHIDSVVAKSRKDGSTHVLAFLDLDRFKLVNDTCGHEAGDELLRNLSKEVSSKLRESDNFARLGGDEFGLLLRGCPIDRAKSIANTVLETISNHEFKWNNQVFHVGVSIGMTTITRHCADTREIMDTADRACFAAKNQGRGQIVLLRPEDLDEADNESQRLPVLIQDAMARDLFSTLVLNSEPVSELGKTIGYREASLSLLLPDGRALEATAIEKETLRYGLFPSLDIYSIEFILSSLKELQNGNQSKSIWRIRLAEPKLLDSEILERIGESIVKHNIDPSSLAFEISEASAFDALSALVNFIYSVNSMGCSITLADIGNGLGSLEYLRALNYDFLKLGNSLIRGISKSDDAEIILEALCRIAHLKGARVVAPHPSAPGDRTLLQHLGVDYLLDSAI